MRGLSSLSVAFPSFYGEASAAMVLEGSNLTDHKRTNKKRKFRPTKRGNGARVPQKRVDTITSRKPGHY